MSRPPTPLSDSSRRSGKVYLVLLPLLWLILAIPDLPSSWLHGVFWVGAGSLMVVLPPERRVPGLWVLLGGGFLLASMAGFLPRASMGAQPWREGLEELGLDTGNFLFIHPLVSLEPIVGALATLVIGVYLGGHRVEARLRHHLALAWALGVAVLVAIAMLRYDRGEVFGFFPNRNHTATLLAMGVIVGAGSVLQAIRYKVGWMLGLSLVALALPLAALIGFSESRAGILLSGLGLVLAFVLVGSRYFGGHGLKLISLLVLGGAGLFVMGDSVVKSRLTETIEKIEKTPALAEEPAGLASPVPDASEELHGIDGRISIYQDTISMIDAAPLTGIGPGQFRYVFPHFRDQTRASNSSVCLHPESDWLMVAAESGVVSAACLALLVVLIAGFAIWNARRGGARSVTMAALVAALVVPMHGLFDVPGHREGLAWSALWLAAFCLPQDARKISGKWRRVVWRGAGVFLALAGMGLVVAHLMGEPLLPSERTTIHVKRMMELQRVDTEAYEAAVAAGRDYDPAPEEDPLEEAIRELEAALKYYPLEARYHHAMGGLGLAYDDKQEMIRQRFEIERALDPKRIQIPLDQVGLLLPVFPEMAVPAFREAVERSVDEANRNPTARNASINAYSSLLRMEPKSPELWELCLDLAEGIPTAPLRWTEVAPIEVVNQRLPDLLVALAETADRIEIMAQWKRRDDSGQASKFEQEHPELFE